MTHTQRTHNAHTRTHTHTHAHTTHTQRTHKAHTTAREWTCPGIRAATTVTSEGGAGSCEPRCCLQAHRSMWSFVPAHSWVRSAGGQAHRAERQSRQSGCGEYDLPQGQSSPQEHQPVHARRPAHGRHRAGLGGEKPAGALVSTAQNNKMTTTTTSKRNTPIIASTSQHCTLAASVAESECVSERASE